MNRDKYALRCLVEVEWEDSNSHGNWGSKDEYAKLTTAQCRSVGYLLRSDRKEIHLVQSVDTKGKMADSISIPRGCVRRIKRILR